MPKGATTMRLLSEAPFTVEMVGEAQGSLMLASGVPIEEQRSIDRIDSTDIVIVPSILLASGTWSKGGAPPA